MDRLSVLFFALFVWAVYWRSDPFDKSGIFYS